MFLFENACKVEEEAYASSEEEAPEDEEPLQVNAVRPDACVQASLCVRRPHPVPSPLETSRISRVFPVLGLSRAAVGGAGTVCAYTYICSTYSHLIFIHPSIPTSRLRTISYRIQIGSFRRLWWWCWCSFCATGSHSHSSVCAPARSARASTNTAAPTSAPTAAATPSTRCRRCRASATTAAAAAW